MFKSLPIAFALLTVFMTQAHAREWRGIVPLKSTKTDVERLFGKPNQLGRYEIDNELVRIFYSSAPCVDNFNVSRANCECLVAKDTVLRISVTLDRAVAVSRLGIDKKNYERTPVNANEPTATYANFTEGVVYTISESEDAVIDIVYWHSAKDCEAIIRAKQEAAPPANSWQGLVPFRSTRKNVERLLGSPKSSLADMYTYETAENRVLVYYAYDPCKASGVAAKGAVDDIVLKISVTPRKTLLVKDLLLDKKKYIRIQLNHPENWVEYRNSADAVTVEAVLDNGCEQVLSVIYQPTSRDRASRCGRNH